MNFGDAIEAAKAGKRIQRAGWNGKGMWVGYTPDSVLEADLESWPPKFSAGRLKGAAKLYAEAEGVTKIHIRGHLDMRAADGSLAVGWLASQTDMLADDWSVVE